MLSSTNKLLRFGAVIAAVIALLGLVEAPGRARAEDTNAKARKLYKSGTGHYALLEYKAALEDFREVYLLSHDPALLYNIAQCHRQLGDPASAAQFYRSFRRESPDAAQRADVDKLIAEMDRLAGERAERAAANEVPSVEHATPVEPSPPSVAAQPITVALTAQPPERKPLYKRGWFWGAIVGGVAVVGAGVALGVVFGGGTRDPKPSIATIPGN